MQPIEKYKTNKRAVAKITLTPNLAQQFLNSSPGNPRKLKPAVVNKYANAMRLGRWRPANGDTIKFDRRGQMRDGHHRCESVILSKTSITVYVATGITEEDVEYIDWCSPRRSSDWLYQKGIKNSVIVGSAVAMLWKYDNGIITSRTIFPDPHDTYEYYKQHPTLEHSLTQARKAKHVLSHASGACLHQIFSRIDPAEADRFFDQLGSGANLKSGDPVLVLRNRLSYNRRKDVQMKMSPTIQMAITVLAWNCRRAKKTIRQLRWTSSEFPEAV